jgi:AhpD family alkylhydroperoxidase
MTGVLVYPSTERRRVYRLRSLAADLGRLVPRGGDVLAIWGRGRVDPVLREQVMVAVARANHCPYCTFAHEHWAAAVGARPADVDAAGRSAVGLDPEAQLAIAYARARTAADFGPVPDELERAVKAGLGPRTMADIDTITRTMTVANRAANTVDALRARLGGRPVAASRLCDEVVVSAGFAAAAPPVVAMLAWRRRRTLRQLLDEFRAFRRRFEDDGDGFPAQER